MHGPRGVGNRHQKQKTVTFDERCEVLQLSDRDDIEDVSYDDEGYGYGFTYQDVPDDDEDHDEPMLPESDYDGSLQVGDDSITGMVESMLEAARPHTPPNADDE